jgi:hypothetical protein
VNDLVAEVLREVPGMAAVGGCEAPSEASLEGTDPNVVRGTPKFKV